MASVIGHPIDYVTLRDAGCKTGFAYMVSLGFAFVNPSPGSRLAMGLGTDSNQNEPERPLLLLLKGRVFDVAQFAAKHPGGEKVLRKLAGEDVDEFMRGERRILGVKHEHSQAAYQMMEKYDVENFQKDDPTLDSKRGVLTRVGNLGYNYWMWIHQPYEGTLRLFDSDFLESLTRTSWWVVPAVWLPIVALFSIFAMSDMYSRWGRLLASFLSISS
ncbi:hypothetical protein Y032_0053g2431 [Ancylostoma ceylanicum]|uniref:Cytochrome b5 heme-binding domain-containing protein n=1 Tax=Ancylostoma ceylanicum TaxID=53326 RepID=A0A016U6S9_9BILA|nr:hypothetical protein Y032_0053g2431 [Ancylostoma ceylanicum]